MPKQRKYNIQVNDQFGKWIVINIISQTHTKLYECKCVCGNVKTQTGYNLIDKKSTQCRTCSNKEKALINFQNLVGSQFGEWTVISRVESKNRATIYLCKCSCGREVQIKADALMSGRTTKCRKCGDYKELKGTIWNALKRNAEQRGLIININQKYILDLYNKQNGECSLSGKKIDLVTHGKNKASLDRIDSSKGYIEGNVQWVHKDVNMMKLNWPEIYFIELCQNIIMHQQNKNNYI